MFRVVKYIIITIFLCSLWVGSAYAEESFTFNDALKTALQNNDQLQAMKSSLSASERDIGIARSNILPHLNLNESFVSTNNQALAFALKISQARFTSSDLNNAPGSFNHPNNITSFVTLAGVNQAIYSRKANIGIKMAKKEYSAQGYDYLRNEENLVNRVAQAFLGINTAQEFVQVAQQGVNDAKEHLKIAQIRYKNELGLYSDVLRAQTAVTEAEQIFITAQKNLNVAKRALGSLPGKKECVNIAGAAPELQLKDANYYNEVASYRNDIKAMQIRVENAKNNIKLANADLYPTIGAGAAYLNFDHRAPFAGEGNSYIAGAYLNWEAFDGLKRKYERSKAKDKEIEAKEYLEYLCKAVSFKVFESYETVEEARKNLELALTSLKSAEEGKRLVLKRWESSLSPIVDLMDAQTNLNRARANLVKGCNDYKSALISLSLESGVITKELSLE